MAAENFVAQFHSLSGTTVGERRKNLFLLLRDFPNPDELDFSFQPNTPLEESLKVDVLIRYKRASELLDLLKCENPILIRKALKTPWLLQETVAKITGEDLVCKIFPFISFNAKVKLLNKLVGVLKDNQGDEFYHAVEKKYGFHLASKLISSCSPQQVLNCAKRKRVKLTERQMLAVLKKHPEIAEELLKIMNEKKVEIKTMYKNVLKYISMSDYELYTDIYGKYQYHIKFGRRRTRRFLRDNKSYVMENPGNYNFLHCNQIAQSLKNDYPTVFQNYFPKKFTDLSSSHTVFAIFNNLPKRIRDINLLTSAFEKLYNKSYWSASEDDFADAADWKLLPLEQRYEKMKTERKPLDISDDEWVCYKKTEESIPILKKAISLTSDIKKRAKLIQLLVTTCYLNNDKKALLHLCKYMLTKHRNDHVSIRKAFLSMISLKMKLEDLDSEHWTAIEELIQLFSLNNESFSKESFQEGYIHFRLKQNLPVKEQLTEWIKEYYYNLNIIRDNAEYHKYCLLMFGELIPELYKEDEKVEVEGDTPTDTRYSRRVDSFIGALEFWNNKYPKDKISIFSYPYIFPRLTEVIQKAKGKWDAMGRVRYVLTTEENCKEKEDLVNLYLSKPDCVDIRIIKWLAYHRPIMIFNNINAVSECVLEDSYYRQDHFFWKWWRNYTHLDNFRKVVEISLQRIKHNLNPSHENTYGLENPVRCLSQLMTAEEFKNFITPYYPPQLCAEGKTKADEVLYTLQQRIGEFIKHIIPSSAVLESILNFCKGDYLKMIQRSLYSVSSRVNEDKLPTFFNELSDRAVSTRKHSMHLALRVLDREQIFKILKHFMEKEKNPSLRKFILKGVFNFFIANEDDYTWEMVKSSIQTVDMEDKEALEVFMQVDKVPLQYMERYITFTWNILDILPDPHNNRESYKNSLLTAISAEMVVFLPEEFINHVLENFFFKIGNSTLTSFSSNVQDLASKYIIYCTSSEEQQRRLNACFEVVKNYVDNMWNLPKHREGCRNCLANFIKEFCDKFLKTQSTNLDILKKFKDAWNSIFQPHQGIKEFIHLELTVYIAQNMRVPRLAQKIAELCDSLGKVYGFAIIEPFYYKVDLLTIYFMTKADESWYALVESILQSTTSPYSTALAITILSKHRSYNEELKEQYERIVASIQKIQSPVLEMYLEIEFRNGKTALDFL